MTKDNQLKAYRLDPPTQAETQANKDILGHFEGVPVVNTTPHHPSVDAWQSMVARLQRNQIERTFASIGQQSDVNPKLRNEHQPNRYDFQGSGQNAELLKALNHLKSKGFTTVVIDGDAAFQKKAAIMGETLGFQTNVRLSELDKQFSKQIQEKNPWILASTRPVQSHIQSL